MPGSTDRRRARRAAWGQLLTTGAALMTTLLVTIQLI